ncbi:MAG: methyltransferase family protein [Candidatus Xenobiia bacterium LiM19]
MEQKQYTFWDRIMTIKRREMYMVLPGYIFVLIPTAVGLAFLGRYIDGRLGLKPFVTPPLSFILFALFTAVGFSIVFWSYTYLVIEGQGSSATHLGGPTQMVTTGPYALVRHPSIAGKFLGVLGLGCLFGSVTFTFVILPLLLTGSLVHNRINQEKYCVKCFGEDYERYREQVPMIIPRPRKVLELLRGPAGKP